MSLPKANRVDKLSILHLTYKFMDCIITIEVNAMLYVTEIHALNLPCSLETCGDWHASAIQWTNPHIRESHESLFGDYGIEQNKNIPEHEGYFNTANHIRALLDLLEAGLFSIAQGMNKDFICNSKYDNEIFEKVYYMRSLANWNEINAFMHKEYMMKWVRFLKSKKV